MIDVVVSKNPRESSHKTMLICIKKGIKVNGREDCEAVNVPSPNRRKSICKHLRELLREGELSNWSNSSHSSDDSESLPSK